MGSRMIDESNKEGSGWDDDDDDDDLSFDDEDGEEGSAVSGAEKAVVERAIGSFQEVDLNQSPPPPPPPALVVSPSRITDENNKKGSGWDDDALSFDDNDRENVV